MARLDRIMPLSLRTLLFVSITLSGVSIVVADMSFNLERALALLLVVPALLWRYSVNSFRVFRRPAAAGDFLFAMWGASLFVSLMLAQDPSAHIKGYIISIIPIIVYLYFSSSSRNEIIVRRSVPVFLCLLSFGGLGAYGLSVAGAEEAVRSLIVGGRLKMWILEPNTFGSTMTFLILLYLPYARRNGPSLTLLLVSLLTVFLSFSRGPYIGFVAGLSAYLILIGAFRAISSKLAVAGVGGLIVLGLFFVSEDILAFYDKFLGRADALHSRAILFRAAIQQFQLHPIMGNGPLDFGLSSQKMLSVIGSDDVSSAWIWQMFVAIAHDSGLVGLTIYAALILWLLAYGIRNSNGISVIYSSYVAAFFSVLIASQSTTLHLSAIFGMAAGLVGAIPKKSSRLRKNLRARTSGA